jgi:hypothetical protein
MAAARSRSKKRFAASGPPERLTFFVDAALGRVLVAEALRSEGLEAVLHDDVFAQGTPDEDWLPEVGRRGWVLLTKDDRIRSTTAQREILLAAGVRAFILSGANLPGPAMADAFRMAATNAARCHGRTWSPLHRTGVGLREGQPAAARALTRSQARWYAGVTRRPGSGRRSSVLRTNLCLDGSRRGR